MTAVESLFTEDILWVLNFDLRKRSLGDYTLPSKKDENVHIDNMLIIKNINVKLINRDTFLFGFQLETVLHVIPDQPVPQSSTVFRCVPLSILKILLYSVICYFFEWV